MATDTVTDTQKENLRVALGLTAAQVAALSIADLRRLRNLTVLTKTDAELAKLSLTDQKKLGGV